MDIIPKFKEIDIYTISLSLIIVYLLSFGIPDPISVINSIIEEPISLFFGTFFIYVMIRSLYYAWVPKLPGKADAGLLVFFALLTTTLALLFGALILFQNLSTDLFSAALAIFSGLSLLRAMGIFLFFRSWSSDRADHFEFRDTPRRQTVLMTVALIVIALIGHFLGISGILLYLAMVESSRIVQILPEIKVR